MSVVISYLITRVLDLLTNVALEQLQLKVNLVTGAEEEVRELSSKFLTVEKLLADAERRSLRERDVGVWLGQLEDVTYEMEDALEEWMLKILKPKNFDLQQGAQNPRRNLPTLSADKVHSFIPSLCSCVKRIPELRERGSIALKIQDINRKLELILRQASQFHFLTSFGGHFNSIEVKPSNILSVSVIDQSTVRGREFDKNLLLNLLLTDNHESSGSSSGGGCRPVKVISIIGAGGSGKTTLAQILFNDDKVMEKFKLRKWVCVSNPFDEKRIANALLESPRTSHPSMSELDPLFRLIKEEFSGRKFLLVLDDVWNDDNSRWIPFRDSLKDGAPGSIILVTTRSERVARAVNTEEKYMHKLGLMSDMDCWLILKHIALCTRPELCKKVEKIGRKIAEKCKGLPLAAKFMGGLLTFKDTVQEWRAISISKIWQMEEAAVELFPHFYLSYNQLPPQLKRCFRYCAVFPKDTRINVEQLIRLWMAQGCLGVPSRRGEELMEMKGLECFNNLAMRSFFQDLARGANDESKIVSCMMHDIVHDFAQFLTRNECRIFDEIECRSAGYLSKERASHVTWLGTSTGTSLSSVVLDSAKVHSFLLCDGEVPSDLFSSLKSVRALTLSSPRLQELPPAIGNLIHLRYLNLSHSLLKELPDTICDLYYLETLDISSCNFLSHLPGKIGELVHLRHLIYEETEELKKKMPPGFENLTSLRTLTEFIAGGSETEFNHIAKLKSLDQLEEIRITVRGRVDLGDAELKKKVYMRKLELYFQGAGRDEGNVSSMERMEPPPNLQIIEFGAYPGRQLPEWVVGDPLFNNLRMLNLFSAPNMTSLPPLGKLPSLEFLWLRKVPNVKHLGREFFGLPETINITDDGDVEVVVFGSLRKLQIEELENWRTWEDLSEDEEKYYGTTGVSVMPRLQEVTISRCDALESLPLRILEKASASSLKRLVINSCRILQASYSSDSSGDNHKKLSKIPLIIWYVYVRAPFN